MCKGPISINSFYDKPTLNLRDIVPWNADSEIVKSKINFKLIYRIPERERGGRFRTRNFTAHKTNALN